MELIPLAIPAGVYHNGTEYQAAGRWYDANLVRWFEGTMRPMGGWLQKTGGSPRANIAVEGKARGSLSWRDNANEGYYAIGTHTKLYVGKIATPIYDITPTGITPGRADSTGSVGYGAVLYGTEGYGTARQQATVILDATTWTIDNFGQTMVAVQSDDGDLYIWDPTDDGTGNPAHTITPTAGTVPTNNQSVIVTQERFVFALGANGNPRAVAWCDQEDLTDWDFASTTNQAGTFDLTTTGRIQCAKRVRGQTLILTTADAHVANYVGLPFVYSFDKVGSGCGVVSKQAASAIDNMAVWMGPHGFWMYDGYIKPLPCEVSDYVFANINVSQLAKVAAVSNTQYFEVIWFFPSANSNENDSYVVWNYRENHWSVGRVSRTTGMDATVFRYPIYVGDDGKVYDHEYGYQYGGALPYVKSGPLEIGTGSRIMMVRQIVPDEKTLGDVQARFASRFYPTSTEYSHGPYSLANPTSVRFTGRQASILVEGVANTDWRVGTIRLDAVPGGNR